MKLHFKVIQFVCTCTTSICLLGNILENIYCLQLGHVRTVRLFGRPIVLGPGWSCPSYFSFMFGTCWYPLKTKEQCKYCILSFLYVWMSVIRIFATWNTTIVEVFHPDLPTDLENWSFPRHGSLFLRDDWWTTQLGVQWDDRWQGYERKCSPFQYRFGKVQAKVPWKRETERDCKRVWKNDTQSWFTSEIAFPQWRSACR